MGPSEVGGLAADASSVRVGNGDVATERCVGGGRVVDESTVLERDVLDGDGGSAVRVGELESNLCDDRGEGECHTFAVWRGRGIVGGIPEFTHVRDVLFCGVL